MRSAGLVALILLLAGCANTAEVTRGGGDAIALMQALDSGARPRVAVGAIVDKTGGGLGAEMSLLGELEPAHNGVLAGIRDMLITELFGSGRFIVLERDDLDTVLAEQEFSHSASVGDATRIPKAQLEGADFIVLGALTAFDAGADGGALPIPIPLSDRGDWGVLNLSAKRGHVAMDLRVIETKTGRIVHSTAVEGRNWSMGLDFAGLFRTGHRIVRLPGLLKLFSNTPVEQALQKMVTAATQRIAEAAQ